MFRRNRGPNTEVLAQLRGVESRMLAEANEYLKAKYMAGETPTRLELELPHSIVRRVSDFRVYASIGRDRATLDHTWAEKAEESCRDAWAFVEAFAGSSGRTGESDD